MAATGIDALNSEERQGLTIWGETISAQVRDYAITDDDLNVIGRRRVLVLHVRDDAPRSGEEYHPVEIPEADVAKLRALLDEADSRR